MRIGIWASMEPCLFRHGKAEITFANMAFKLMLQWSHVFSDMVRFFVGDEYDNAVKLQWSHVFSDMVRIEKALESYPILDASMEPCLFRHGKYQVSTGYIDIYSCFNGAMSFQTW